MGKLEQTEFKQLSVTFVIGRKINEQSTVISTLLSYPLDFSAFPLAITSRIYSHPGTQSPALKQTAPSPPQIPLEQETVDEQGEEVQESPMVRAWVMEVRVSGIVIAMTKERVGDKICMVVDDIDYEWFELLRSCNEDEIPLHSL